MVPRYPDHIQTIPRVPRAGQLCVCLCVLILAVLSCTQSARSDADPAQALAGDMENILRDPALGSAHLGVVIDSVTTGHRLFELNGSKRFVPASNMKLFTSAAALIALTPDYRYETRVLTAGSLRSGILHGDLIIEGSGDPTISGYFNGGDPLHVFRQWTTRLKEMGVREIRGNLIIDNSAFTGQPYPTGWEIGDATNCFSARKDAFTFNNNCIQLDITPGRGREGIRLAMEPVTGYVRLHNRLTQRQGSDQGMVGFEYTTPRTLLITGSVGTQDDTITRYVAVNHPAYFGGFVFKETLAANGIAMKGEIVCARNCPRTIDIREVRRRKTFKTAAVYRSPKLSEIIKVVNKLSNNLYAELLLFATGKVTGDDSPNAALTTLSNAGIDIAGVAMADGSGLSRHNLVTPGAIVDLLKAMAQGPYASCYIESLPVMSMDGTLGNRLTGSAAEGRIRAKTGSMTHVRSLSGFVTTKNNEILAFSILSNNYDADVRAVDSVIDRIILRLLDHPSAER